MDDKNTSACRTSTFEMRIRDLGELYALLSMYVSTYHTETRDTELLNEIREHFQDQAALHKSGDTLPSLMNVRGAGRKPSFSEAHNKEILRLRQEGKTIRAIAEETSCSIGHVHKLIHEHNVSS